MIKIRAKLQYRLDVSWLAKLVHVYHCKESLLNRSVMWYILYITNLKVIGVLIIFTINPHKNIFKNVLTLVPKARRTLSLETK